MHLRRIFFWKKEKYFFELLSQCDSISEAVKNGDNKFRMKVGDGINLYNDLPYVGDRNDKPLTFKMRSNSGGILYDVVMGE